MKVLTIIAAVLLWSLSSWCQTKKLPLDQKGIPWEYLGDKHSEGQAWNSYLSEKEMEKTTGLILNGHKYNSGRFDTLIAIPSETIKELKIIKDSATVRKYFIDTTIRFVFIVNTK